MLTIDDHVGFATVPAGEPPGSSLGGGARGHASFAAASDYRGRRAGRGGRRSFGPSRCCPWEEASLSGVLASPRWRPC
eukprot:4888076-Lingulodinium_polyedra.AAC.1